MVTGALFCPHSMAQTTQPIQVREPSVDQVVEHYHKWRINYDHSSYKTEDKPFWDYIVLSPVVVQTRLSFQEYVEVGRRFKSQIWL